MQQPDFALLGQPSVNSENDCDKTRNERLEGPGSSLKSPLFQAVGSQLPVENLVEVRDVDFSYDVRPVLKGINMNVPRGKVVSIMGLSGCGKTTLLRLIGGSIMPSKGEVRVAGRVVHELDQDELYAMRRRMGMLFQFGALFTDMSALDNVAFQIREHTGLPESMVQDLALMKLHAVGLRGAAHMMPSELSGGMARRVALARTIALDPMLIMYDEPFTGLDPIAMGVIGELIKKLNEVLGATSIIVTHDVQESLKIVDYIYFMADGAVVTEGTPEDIRRSAAPFVHQFVWGEIDGPMPFHYPGLAVGRDFGVEARHA
jgi:phospholipid/cholesterol/gamma-HCH transport system ATP-binding protein